MIAPISGKSSKKVGEGERGFRLGGKGIIRSSHFLPSSDVEIQ
jgi:hypothetical protein